MTRAVELGRLYAQARRDLAIRQWTGVTPDWPERPVWLPADFGELELTAIAFSFRREWANDYPPPADGIVPPPPEGAEDWSWIGYDWDIDALISHIDGMAETTAAAVAFKLAPLDELEYRLTAAIEGA
jgi:hypothetical protein